MIMICLCDLQVFLFCWSSGASVHPLIRGQHRLQSTSQLDPSLPVSSISLGNCGHLFGTQHTYLQLHFQTIISNFTFTETRDWKSIRKLSTQSLSFVTLTHTKTVTLRETVRHLLWSWLPAVSVHIIIIIITSSNCSKSFTTIVDSVWLYFCLITPSSLLPLCVVKLSSSAATAASPKHALWLIMVEWVSENINSQLAEEVKIDQPVWHSKDCTYSGVEAVSQFASFKFCWRQRKFTGEHNEMSSLCCAASNICSCLQPQWCHQQDRRPSRTSFPSSAIISSINPSQQKHGNCHSPPLLHFHLR